MCGGEKESGRKREGRGKKEEDKGRNRGRLSVC